MHGRKLKRGFKVCFLLTGTDLIGGGPPTDQQPNGVDEQRLSRTGFSGQNRKSRLKTDMELLNEREIDDAQLGKHRGEENDPLMYEPKSLKSHPVRRSRRVARAVDQSSP